MHVTLKELHDYTAEEQARWEAWFREHGEEPLDIPLQGDLLISLRVLMLHFMGTQLWFAETLLGRPITEFWKQSLTTSSDLFELGTKGKQLMGEVIETFQPDDWKRMIELPVPGNPIKVSARKCAVNAMIHEIRHWAQAATIVRQNGIAPPGKHDIILSGALE